MLSHDEYQVTPTADENDRASMREMQFNAEALEKARKRAGPESHPDFDGKHCVECDEVIHKERIKLGKVRCVHCQSILEKRNRH